MICKIAAIRHLEFLKFRVCVMRPLMPCYSPSLCKNSLKSENLLLSYGQKNDCLKWRLSAILNFRGAIMGSLKMPCRTSYWSSIETIILDCFVYEKIAFLSRRSPGMGSRTARSRPRPRPVSSRPKPRPVINKTFIKAQVVHKIEHQSSPHCIKILQIERINYRQLTGGRCVEAKANARTVRGQGQGHDFGSSSCPRARGQSSRTPSLFTLSSRLLVEAIFDNVKTVRSLCLKQRNFVSI